MVNPPWGITPPPPPWCPDIIGENIIQVGWRVLFIHYDCCFCNCFLSAMISNAMVLLCQGQLCPRRVCTDGPVVTEDVLCTVYWDPKHKNLQQWASMISTEFFVAVNLDPNVDASTNFSLLLNQIIGGLLQNNKILVWEYLISVDSLYRILGQWSSRCMYAHQWASNRMYAHSTGMHIVG